ncbi:MAG: Ger(x)C family spore germination protein [Anaerobacillus sp.]
MKIQSKAAKSITKCGVVFSLLSFLTGCWDLKEVNDLAIVIATGIDKTEDESIEVTLMVYMPNPSSGSSSDMSSGQSGNNHIISIQADTFADAISELEIRIPRKIFWGHSNIFIFGSELAKDGLSQQTDFIIRSIEPREQAIVYISEGPAKDHIMNFIKLNIAEIFSKIPKNRAIKAVTLKDIEEIFLNITQTGIIPVSSGYDIITASGETMAIAVNGSAVFHHGKLIDIMKGEKDIGTYWTVFPEVNFPVTVPTHEGKVTLNPIRKSYKLIPSIEHGKWKVTINIKGNLEVIQNTSTLNLIRMNDLVTLQKETNDKIENDVRLFVEVIQKELQADVLHFDEAFHRHYPKQMESKKVNWQQELQDVEVNIQVDTTISRTGITNLRIEK